MQRAITLRVLRCLPRLHLPLKRFNTVTRRYGVLCRAPVLQVPAAVICVPVGTSQCRFITKVKPAAADIRVAADGGRARLLYADVAQPIESSGNDATEQSDSMVGRLPQSPDLHALPNGVPTRSTVVQDATLHHRPSGVVVGLSSAEVRRISLFFGSSGNVVNVDFGARPLQDITSPLSLDRLNDAQSSADAKLAPAFHVPDTATDVRSARDKLWRETSWEYSQLPDLYMRLAKIRLTGLVVVTTMAGYALAPGVFDLTTLLLCSFGTGLTSASANTINQFFEVPFDSQMNRTKNRPLVRGLLSPLHAAVFASVTGSLGVAVLYSGVNGLTASLGLFNLCLYTLVYTPMKRLSIANTWVGAVVGAVPPMMGWAAAVNYLHPGAWLLAGVMFAWQFPHFCALSWNLRGDYSRAGYRMMSVVAPDLCRVTALRYSAVLSALCCLAPVLGVTTPMFALLSAPLNTTLVWLAWRFYRQGDSATSRQLFRFSLIHLPAMLLLMWVCKRRAAGTADAAVIADVPLDSVSALALTSTGDASNMDTRNVVVPGAVMSHSDVIQ